MAPFDVILNPESSTRAWQPDVLFISNERKEIITDENIQGAPDLVIEVLSKSTQNRDLGPKKRAYEENGVREYWVVWSDLPRIEIYHRREAGRYGDPHLLEEGDILTTDLLPGFSWRWLSCMLTCRLEVKTMIFDKGIEGSWQGI